MEYRTQSEGASRHEFQCMIDEILVRFGLQPQPHPFDEVVASAVNGNGMGKEQEPGEAAGQTAYVPHENNRGIMQIEGNVVRGTDGPYDYVDFKVPIGRGRDKKLSIFVLDQNEGDARGTNVHFEFSSCLQTNLCLSSSFNLTLFCFPFQTFFMNMKIVMYLPCFYIISKIT